MVQLATTERSTKIGGKQRNKVRGPILLVQTKVSEKESYRCALETFRCAASLWWKSISIYFGVGVLDDYQLSETFV